MSNSFADQISQLPDDDQQRFHEEVQRSLRRQWAEAKEQTEKEIDETNKKRSNY